MLGKTSIRFFSFLQAAGNTAQQSRALRVAQIEILRRGEVMREGAIYDLG